MLTETKQIYYKEGYKYQLERTAFFHTAITPKSGQNIETQFLSLSTDGWLKIKAGYAWDGASGPTVDTTDSMRPSLAHDALCQLCRMGYIDPLVWMSYINDYFQKLCIEDGMFVWRAHLWRAGVAIGAESASSARNIRRLKTAPEKRKISVE